MPSYYLYMTACDWKYAQYPTILLLFMLTVERYCLVAGIDNVILFVSFIVVHNIMLISSAAYSKIQYKVPFNIRRKTALCCMFM